MPLFLLLHLFGLVTSLLRFSEAPPAGDPPADDPPPVDDDQDVSKLKEALRKERENTKQYKTLQREAEELRKFKQEQEQAKLTADEKLTAREKATADKEQALTARERRATLRDEVARQIAADKVTLVAPVADVLAFLDADAVEWDATGKPSNLAQQLKTVLKERPYLIAKRSGSGDGGEGDGNSPRKETMNDLIRGAARGD